MYAATVHTAAAAELVVWGYEVRQAQQTQPGPPHRESHSVSVGCPPAKKGPSRRRQSVTTNQV